MEKAKKKTSDKKTIPPLLKLFLTVVKRIDDTLTFDEEDDPQENEFIIDDLEDAYSQLIALSWGLYFNKLVQVLYNSNTGKQISYLMVLADIIDNEFEVVDYGRIDRLEFSYPWQAQFDKLVEKIENISMKKRLLYLNALEKKVEQLLKVVRNMLTMSKNQLDTEFNPTRKRIRWFSSLVFLLVKVEETDETQVKQLLTNFKQIATRKGFTNLIMEIENVEDMLFITYNPEELLSLLGMKLTIDEDSKKAILTIGETDEDEELEELLRHGEQLTRDGELDKVEKVFLDTEQLYPNNSDVLSGLAVVRHEQGDVEETIAYLKQALKYIDEDNHATKIQTLMNLGEVMHTQERYEEAATYFEQLKWYLWMAQEVGLQDFEKHMVNYSSALYELKKYEQAKKLLEEVLYLYPDVVFTWHNLGKALKALGQLEQAEEALTKAEELLENE